MRKLIVLVGLGAAAVAFRKKLVHLLTRLTGTWVGTPRA